MISSYNNIACLFIVFNLVFACLYSPFIVEVNPLHLISAFFTVAISFIAFLTILYRGYLNKHELLFLFIIIAILLQSALYFINGISPNELVRSNLPFLYLPLFSLLCIRLNPANLDLTLKTLMLIGVLVSLIVIPFFIELLIVNSLNYTRYTAYLDLTHTPIMIMAVPLVYGFKKKYKYVYLFIIFVAIFATQSKGQIIFAIGALVFCESVGKKFNAKAMTKIFLLLLVLAAPVFVFKDTIAKRFLDVTGNTSSHRVEEIIVATQYIISNPILGAGPGVTFSITNTNVEAEDSEEQRYIHNIILYLLATGGVIGLLIMLLPYFALLRIKLENPKAKYVSIAILFSFFYLLVSATFKSIQTNMFMGILIGSCIQLSLNKNKINEKN